MFPNLALLQRLCIGFPQTDAAAKEGKQDAGDGEGVRGAETAGCDAASSVHELMVEDQRGVERRPTISAACSKEGATTLNVPTRACPRHTVTAGSVPALSVPAGRATRHAGTRGTPRKLAGWVAEVQIIEDDAMRRCQETVPGEGAMMIVVRVRPSASYSGCPALPHCDSR